MVVPLSGILSGAVIEEAREGKAKVSPHIASFHHRQQSVPVDSEKILAWQLCACIALVVGLILISSLGVIRRFY